MRPSWQIPAQTITLPPRTHMRKMFHTPAVHTITSIAKRKWKSGFITKKDVLTGVKLPMTRAWPQASLAILWRCLRIGPNTGRLARNPDSRSLLRTVCSENRTFARPGVLRAVSSSVIIRSRRWIRHKCLSRLCEVTRSLLSRVCH